MITAASNSRIKRLAALNQKARLRREEDVFLTEGVRMFREAPEEMIREVYVSERFLERRDCREKLSRTGYEVVADALFPKISDTCAPQGILCVLKQFHYARKDMTAGFAPLFLILENIQDPGNLGTMLRTAEGAGASGVILSADTADIYNPKVIRSTMGSIYRVPFLRTEDLAGEIKALKNLGVRVYAAHLQGTGTYCAPDYRGASAFLIGNEGNGLTEATAALADERIRIPMSGKVESLNAAVSAALLLYEARRQREEKED